MSSSFIILHYFSLWHYFFNSEKIEFSKDLGERGAGVPPPTPFSTGRQMPFTPSKVTYNLPLGKTKRKSQQNLKIVERKETVVKHN